MHNLGQLGGVFGRACIALAMMAFGVQHLVYSDFITRLVPKLPGWIPGHSLLAWIFGVYLIATGLALFLKQTARVAALLLCAVLFVSLTVLYLPALAANPGDMGLWTKAGKTLTFAGGALLIVGSLPLRYNEQEGTLARFTNPLEKCVPLGRYFLAGFFAFCGVLHFFYVPFVAGLVPSWIPGHVFWTYFSGTALILAGVGISLHPTERTAATLSAVMVFIWVLILHIPRALSDLHDSNETTAVFEAIAVTGTALLVATRQRLGAIERSCEVISHLSAVGGSSREFANVPAVSNHRSAPTQL